MKDSLFQRFAARKTQLSFPQFTKLYFESIFGTAFQKKIAYKKNKEAFECEWCFDNEALPNKLYISRKNKFIRFFTGPPKKNVQKFSYLSFFEVYDYEIKNEIIDRPS